MTHSRIEHAVIDNLLNFGQEIEALGKNLCTGVDIALTLDLGLTVFGEGRHILLGIFEDFLILGNKRSRNSHLYNILLINDVLLHINWAGPEGHCYNIPSINDWLLHIIWAGTSSLNRWAFPTSSEWFGGLYHVCICGHLHNKNHLFDLCNK